METIKKHCLRKRNIFQKHIMLKLTMNYGTSWF